MLRAWGNPAFAQRVGRGVQLTQEAYLEAKAVVEGNWQAVDDGPFRRASGDARDLTAPPVDVVAEAVRRQDGVYAAEAQRRVRLEHPPVMHGSATTAGTDEPRQALGCRQRPG